MYNLKNSWPLVLKNHTFVTRTKVTKYLLLWTADDFSYFCPDPVVWPIYFPDPDSECLFLFVWQWLPAVLEWPHRFQVKHTHVPRTCIVMFICSKNNLKWPTYQTVGICLIQNSLGVCAWGGGGSYRTRGVRWHTWKCGCTLVYLIVLVQRWNGCRCWGRYSNNLLLTVEL